MENVRIFIDGIQKDVYGIFYVFDSKYYFIYTEKEVDENGYVVLYMCQVGKETKNTETGPMDTGYMVGVEVSTPEEQQKVQTSVSYIVEDKKNNTVNPQIQYLPKEMLTNLKIVSKKRFRLLKSIIVDNFKVPFDDVSSASIPVDNVANIVDSVIPLVQVATSPVQTVVAPVSSEVQTPTIPTSSVVPIEPIVNTQPQPLQNLNGTVVPTQAPTIVDNSISTNEDNVIIDYRSKYFEEEEKNKELQAQIEVLTQKLNDIKKVVE